MQQGCIVLLNYSAVNLLQHYCVDLINNEAAGWCGRFIETKWWYEKAETFVVLDTAVLVQAHHPLFVWSQVIKII